MKIPNSIESDRLVLRLVDTRYASEINKYMTENVVRLMFIGREDVDKTIEWTKRTEEKNKTGKQFSALIFDKNTDELLGGGGVHELDTDTPDLGIWIKESAWGNGYGREAMQAVKDWLDSELDYKYLVYPVDKKNLPSRKIPESLGGHIEREYPLETPSGKVLDVVEYHIYKK